MTALETKMKIALSSRKSRANLRQVPYTNILNQNLIDFSSNSYLSLDRNLQLRARFLTSIQSSRYILGSGGSRLLDGGTKSHAALEQRLSRFFQSPAALLFNSGFEANVSIFTCLPQPGDTIVYDEYIHASVHDGMRLSRARDPLAFRHNCPISLNQILARLVEDDKDLLQGKRSVFVAVESLYSMDGDLAPLVEICDVVEKVLPLRNGYIICDEAHATGIYGKNGRGLVSALGLEARVFVRLHTWGKALAGQGALVLSTPLVREYLINYARPLIYSTAMSHTTVIAMGCAVDMLEDGSTAELSERLLSLCAYFTTHLRRQLSQHSVSPHLMSLPIAATLPSISPFHSPIIPVLTSHPKPLAAYLQRHNLLVRPISHPTVPKGRDRVRVCIHAENSQEEVDRLIQALIDWVHSFEAIDRGPETDLTKIYPVTGLVLGKL